MLKRNFTVLAAFLSMGLALTHNARAQWAVVDIPATVQLVQQVATTKQQLETALNQLQQAKQALDSMTGRRGMERLLNGTVRNYLPFDWDQLSTSLKGLNSGYSGLSKDVQNALRSVSVLSPENLLNMAPPERKQIEAVRQWVALQTALSRQALAATSGRFTAIQSLINAIPQATDQKAILDLQARISAEQNMLQNEQTKLQVLTQNSQAQAAANQLQLRELAIAGHGQFETRFQPKP